MKNKIVQPAKEQNEVLIQSGSYDLAECTAGLTMLAEALESPLRQGILNGDITSDIFQKIPVGGDRGTSTPEFPLDFLAPGTENDFVAYTLPKHGYIPQRNISGDFVVVPTFPVGNAIDWNLRYARDARWDIVTKALNVMRMGFVKKDNDDAWHTLISAAKDRLITVFDSDAAPGQFTKRVVSVADTVMRRNGGGNSSSVSRGKLTDIFLSPEAVQDIRNWNVDQVDEITRREIFLNSDSLTRIFGVNLHDIDEFGEGQEYQTYYTSIGGVMPAPTTGTKVEIAIGLDLTSNDSFVNPVREELSIYADPTLHRQQRAGFYGWSEKGWGVLDNRRVLVISI
jgi:hypothetical protein